MFEDVIYFFFSNRNFEKWSHCLQMQTGICDHQIGFGAGSKAILIIFMDYTRYCKHFWKCSTSGYVGGSPSICLRMNKQRNESDEKNDDTQFCKLVNITTNHFNEIGNNKKKVIEYLFVGRTAFIFFLFRNKIVIVKPFLLNIYRYN